MSLYICSHICGSSHFSMLYCSHRVWWGLGCTSSHDSFCSAAQWKCVLHIWLQSQCSVSVAIMISSHQNPFSSSQPTMTYGYNHIRATTIAATAILRLVVATAKCSKSRTRLAGLWFLLMTYLLLAHTTGQRAFIWLLLLPLRTTNHHHFSTVTNVTQHILLPATVSISIINPLFYQLSVRSNFGRKISYCHSHHDTWWLLLLRT